MELSEEEQQRLDELLAQNVKDITEVVADMDAEEVEAVKAAEAQGQNRTGVIKAADARLAELNNDDEADQSEASDEGGKAARGEMPEWKHPDYSGPLTGEQALWRNENLRTK